MKTNDEEVLVCTDCLEEVDQIGEDCLDYCYNCNSIVEGLGRTKRIPRDEYEENKNE